jgi:hypothetical protein
MPRDPIGYFTAGTGPSEQSSSTRNGDCVERRYGRQKPTIGIALVGPGGVSRDECVIAHGGRGRVYCQCGRRTRGIGRD